jgi:hypothetical protein
MTQAQIARAIAIYTWDGYDADEIGDRLNPRDFDDMAEVCRTMGAVGTKLPSATDNSDIMSFLFPDGSTANVILNADGIGCGIEDVLP